MSSLARKKRNFIILSLIIPTLLLIINPCWATRIYGSHLKITRFISRSICA